MEISTSQSVTLSLVAILDGLNRERITNPRDIVASFTELQADMVMLIQSEILQLRIEMSQLKIPPIEAVDLRNRLSEALHRYGWSEVFSDFRYLLILFSSSTQRL
jgi:hypothetical protein